MTDNITLDEIWLDDVLGRREEALLLIGYIESISKRAYSTGYTKSYTIAIDADYGYGKTFFLNRLAKTLSLNHPVAYVDAWSDDLSDEPLVALTATLKEAFSPLLSTPKIRSNWDNFVKKGGDVAKIAAAGLAKKGLGLLLTSAAVGMIDEVLNDPGEATGERAYASAKEIADGTISDVDSALKLAHGSLAEKIDRFSEGKNATLAMKQSLETLIQAISGTDLNAPAVIVIDELDRCRPTYAIKLLEEIKHLFDVPGIAFIFGLHGDQLAHSVSGAYGVGFDGSAYLDRFLNRRYTLTAPTLKPLLTQLLATHGISDLEISWPTPILDGHQKDFSLSELLSEYCIAYNISPRDAFSLVDMLQTSIALTHPHKPEGAYLVPLIIGHIKHRGSGNLPLPVAGASFGFSRDYRSNDTIGLEEIARNFAELSQRQHAREIAKRYGGDDTSYVVHAIFNARTRHHNGNNPRCDLASYPKLVGEVSRFVK